MLALPKSTEYGKRIPKQKFYEHMAISPQLKRIFVEQVKAIQWRNKLATSTLNVGAGQVVTEIEVIEIALTHPQLDESLLRHLDMTIPYHIVFLLSYEGKYQVWTAYKELDGKKEFKVQAYYHTDWLEAEDIPLRIAGLDLDKVYENFVRQIGGDRLQASDAGESLMESVEKDERRKALTKQIDVLQKKIRKEKQLKLQMEMRQEMKRLQKELSLITL
jgi:hypothetical protein